MYSLYLKISSVSKEIDNNAKNSKDNGDLWINHYSGKKPNIGEVMQSITYKNIYSS